MARCADLLSEALGMSIPLRGALAVGKAMLHERTSTFVGPPIVEAAKLEQAQDWVGACLGPAMLAADVAREFDPNLVLPYPVPFKKGQAGLVSGLALDWPRRYTSKFGQSSVEALQALDTSPAHHRYYGNAIEFAKHSGGPLFRSDSFHAPNLGNLVGVSDRSRRSGKSLSRRDEYVLNDLARSGEIGQELAAFLRNAVSRRGSSDTKYFTTIYQETSEISELRYKEIRSTIGIVDLLYYRDGAFASSRCGYQSRRLGYVRYTGEIHWRRPGNCQIFT